jgi:hypothetical protein
MSDFTKNFSATDEHGEYGEKKDFMEQETGVGKMTY